MPSQLFSIEEAARRCGIGRAKFCTLIADGSIRSVKIGKRRLISDTAISEFIAGLEQHAQLGGAA